MLAVNAYFYNTRGENPHQRLSPQFPQDLLLCRSSALFFRISHCCFKCKQMTPPSALCAYIQVLCSHESAWAQKILMVLTGVSSDYLEETWKFIWWDRVSKFLLTVSQISALCYFAAEDFIPLGQQYIVEVSTELYSVTLSWPSLG